MGRLVVLSTTPVTTIVTSYRLTRHLVHASLRHTSIALALELLHLGCCRLHVLGNLNCTSEGKANFNQQLVHRLAPQATDVPVAEAIV